MNFAVQIPPRQFRGEKCEILSLKREKHQKAIPIPLPQAIHHAATKAALGVVGEDQGAMWKSMKHLRLQREQQPIV